MPLNQKCSTEHKQLFSLIDIGTFSHTQKPKATAASKKTAADRNAARQRLLAAKAAMKAKATRSKDNEKVVFDAGFFKVESPVRSPKVHCEGKRTNKVYLVLILMPLQQSFSSNTITRFIKYYRNQS